MHWSESYSKEHFEVLTKMALHLQVSNYEAAQEVKARFGIYAPLFYDYCVDYLNYTDQTQEEELEF